MVVRPSRQPGFDNSRFVSGVIVHDDMNVETLGNAHVDLLQEVQELRSSMMICLSSVRNVAMTSIEAFCASVRSLPKSTAWASCRSFQKRVHADRPSQAGTSGYHSLWRT